MARKMQAPSLKIKLIRGCLRRGLYLFVLFVVLAMITNGCRKTVPLQFPTPVDSSRIGKIKSVVILGNSIVRSSPDPAIGWLGDWGMAASSKETDFVHLLIAKLRAKDNHITVKFKNIADFEHRYKSFDYASVDSLRNADLIVMKIGENVNPDGSDYPGFIYHYHQLMQYLDSNNKAVKIIVDGFWEKVVNDKIRNYAVEKGYPLITITDLSGSSKNKGTAGHPSDRGMQLIAERLWNYMGVYFQ